MTRAVCLWTMAFVCMYWMVACSGGNENPGSSDIPSDMSSDASSTPSDVSDTDAATQGERDAAGDGTQVVEGFCGGGCAEGEICVFAAVGDTEASCVDPRPGIWDDGSDPDKRLVRVGDGWHRKRVDAWEAESARCNDGSPYAYHFRKGNGDGVNRWLIYFKGGGSCLSEEECAIRWITQNQFMSSTSDGFTPTKGDHGREQGVYALEEPTNPFKDWNMVHVYYCSSDTFAGTLSPPASPLGLWFRGEAIVTAMVRELLAGFDTSELGFDLPPMSEAEVVVVAGGSAGAGAARLHMDRIASLIKTLNPASVVNGLSDAAFQAPIAPELYGGDVSGGAFHGAEGFGDVDCLAAHPDSPGLCGNAAHLITGHGAAGYYGEADAGHLGIAGPGEAGAVDGLFVFMAQWDAKARSNSRVNNICVRTECTSDAECQPGEACLYGLCYRGEPCTPELCDPDDGLCWGPDHATGCIAEIATLRHQCGADGDCDGGDICEQGLCVEPIYMGCADTSECPDGYLCLSNLCTRSAASAGECPPSYVFVEDMEVCEQVTGCGQENVCGTGHTCVSYQWTPRGATFSWGIRTELTGLGPDIGVFVPNNPTHTAARGEKFYAYVGGHRAPTLTIEGLTFADVLGEWLAGSPGYHERIAVPMRVPIPLFAQEIETAGHEGITSRTSGTGCEDDALFFVFCERSQDCDRPDDALYAVGIGDAGATTFAGAALDRPGPLELAVVGNPACSDVSLELERGEFISLRYQRDGDAAHAYGVRVSLPPTTIRSDQLPLTLYVGMDGATYLDAELTEVGGGRLR